MTSRIPPALVARLLTLAIVAMSMVRSSPAAGASWRDQDSTPRCIAMVLPSVQGVDGSATEVGTALRDLFASYLTGPAIRTVTLDTRLPSQAVEEARQKECGLVLVASLTRKRGGGGVLGKALGQAAGTAAWHIPGGGTVGSAVARGAAAGSAQAVAAMATSTRAKDEMRLEYRMSSLDGAARLAPTTDKAKAQSDGEDLLTPLVARAAEAIVGVLAKK